MEPGVFQGVVGRTYSDSVPWWPEPGRAPAGSPNVLLIVLDDVGFAQLGCFGSDLATPSIDGLAESGLTYTNFHTTALCSPTRSCLLTGRNHHANGMGRIVELATGFPGYDAHIPKANGFLSEILLECGYATFAVGKWHLAPSSECHLGASRQRWPLGRGFERFYGFMEGETHQGAPALVSDNHFVDPPASYRDGYHLTTDLVDQAISFIQSLKMSDPSKPFFMYFCPGACHAPHQAPAEWIDRYRGAFDEGWDAWRQETLARQLDMGLLPATTELSPRPDWVPAWDSLSEPERALYARYMEAFAGFLSHTDDQLGRLVRVLQEMGEMDNTFLVLLSDNGASSEGGPTGSVNDARPWNMAPRALDEALRRVDEIGGPRMHNNYPWGWTVAGNTPFRRWKREVHEGGVADPLIIRWPRGLLDSIEWAARGDSLKNGGATAGVSEAGVNEVGINKAGDANVRAMRRQYVHAIDVMPTVLDLLGIEVPERLHGIAQRPLDGVSFRHTFHSPSAPSRRRTQYYEMFGCRALYHEGWKAVTYEPMQDPSVRFSKERWELYHVDLDPSECHDLSERQPRRLQTMIDRWWIEASRGQVLPLDNLPFSAFVLARPPAVPPRHRYVYWPGEAGVPEAVAVNVRNRSHQIYVDVDIPPEADGVEGVLLALGSGLGGWVFYVSDNRLAYVHNFVGLEEHRIGSQQAVPTGRHVLEFRFEKEEEHKGTGNLLIDGERVGSGEIPRFTPFRFSLTGAGLTCGRGDPVSVTRRFEGTFPFSATVLKAVVEVDGDEFVDPEAEANAAVVSQ